MVGFCDLVETGIVPLSKKAAVKVIEISKEISTLLYIVLQGKIPKIAYRIVA